MLSEVKRQMEFTLVQSSSANTLADCEALTNAAKTCSIIKSAAFWEAFFVVRPRCVSVCRVGLARHLAAGRFRSWRAVRRASVLSAPCESQCGRIRRISGGESCWFERRTDGGQQTLHRVLQQALCRAVCVRVRVTLCHWATDVTAEGEKFQFVRRNETDWCAALDDRIAATTAPLFSSHNFNLPANLSVTFPSSWSPILVIFFNKNNSFHYLRVAEIIFPQQSLISYLDLIKIVDSLLFHEQDKVVHCSNNWLFQQHQNNKYSLVLIISLDLFILSPYFIILLWKQMYFWFILW